MKYRIREFDGKFTIQTTRTIIKWSFLGKQLIEEWSRCLGNGKPRPCNSMCWLPLSDVFTKKEDAINQILSWEKGVKFYYHPEDTINKK